MSRKIPPRFTSGLTPGQRDDQLNAMARDLYTLYGGFEAAPPLEVTQDTGGVRYSLAQIQPVWIKVTSASPQTITLPGGTTISGYPAVVDSWGNTTGVWTDGSTVWFIGANGEAPTNGTRYQCRLLGVDINGVAIWATVIQATTPATYSASGTHTLTSTAGQSTGIAVTITTAGLYLVTCSIPGEYSHSVGAGNSESLQCWLALSSGFFPMNYVTVACVNNPTGGAYASPSTSYGTACITGLLNVTSPPLTITLWTQIAGALALGTAIIGTTQNNAANSPALLSAVQIP